MASVNRVILVGELTKPSEQYGNVNGKQIAKNVIKTSETKDGKEYSEYNVITCFGDAAKELLLLTPGQKVSVEGSLKTRNPKPGVWMTEVYCHKLSKE